MDYPIFPFSTIYCNNVESASRMHGIILWVIFITENNPICKIRTLTGKIGNIPILSSSVSDKTDTYWMITELHEQIRSVTSTSPIKKIVTTYFCFQIVQRISASKSMSISSCCEIINFHILGTYLCLF